MPSASFASLVSWPRRWRCVTESSCRIKRFSANPRSERTSRLEACLFLRDVASTRLCAAIERNRGRRCRCCLFVPLRLLLLAIAAFLAFGHVVLLSSFLLAKAHEVQNHECSVDEHGCRQNCHGHPGYALTLRKFDLCGWHEAVVHDAVVLMVGLPGAGRGLPVSSQEGNIIKEGCRLADTHRGRCRRGRSSD